MNIYHTHIDRVTIYAPFEERDKVHAYIERHGYHVTRSGPRRVSLTRYDTKQIHVIAEKEIEKLPRKQCEP